MASRPWYAFYPADYEQDTAHLTLVQHGAYRRLLDHYYSTAKPLPANAGILHRVCRAFDDAEKAAVNHIMATYFKLQDDGYHSARVDKELLKASEISKIRQSAANSRYAKAPANAVQKHTQPQPQLHKDKKEEAAVAALPVWLDIEAWGSFLEMRRRKRAPVTPRATGLLVAKLDRWRIKGHDPTMILDASTASAWTDLYEPKEDNQNGRQPKQSNHERAFDVAKELAADLAAGRWQPGQSGETSSPRSATITLLPARPKP